MLFPLFIPAAFYALHVRSELEFNPVISYTEDLAELGGSLSQLDLEGLAKTGTMVNNLFQSQGVSFSMGVPQRLADLKEDGNVSAIENATKGFIAISGYTFVLPSRPKLLTVAPFDVSGSFRKRFVGQTTIMFHQPDEPETRAGVHRVGFYVSRLNTPGSMLVTLYSPDGRLIGSRTNEGSAHVFMGFKCNEEIGWLELETVEGKDNNYAVGNIVFDEIK